MNLNPPFIYPFLKFQRSSVSHAIESTNEPVSKLNGNETRDSKLRGNSHNLSAMDQIFNICVALEYSVILYTMIYKKNISGICNINFNIFNVISIY